MMSHAPLFDILILQKIQSITFIWASMNARRVHCAQPSDSSLTMPP